MLPSRFTPPRAKRFQMHKEHGLQFRSYVPVLMELLEDADGMVRDVAKGTVIELFKCDPPLSLCFACRPLTSCARTAPNAAKSDLKRQLKNFKVRPAIEQAIVKALAPTLARPDTPSDAAALSRSNLAASVSSISSERPTTPMVDMQAEPIEPMYVNTNRELDDIFRDMAWHFEGRETEQNWMKREQAMGTLRKLNAGNAPADFHDTFLGGLRSMLDGIIKAVTSLRTSLSKEGCGLVQDMAITFGPAMDMMVELLMQTFVKLSAGTKKISSQQANVTVDTIVGRVSYSLRLMQHIWGACQDKNVQPRMYATGWLKTLIKKEAHHKSIVEHTGGVDLMEKCIKRCLGDANPGVRENMRSTYWAFWAVWPARADAYDDPLLRLYPSPRLTCFSRIMADLDPTAQKLLNKDPHNPNSSIQAAEPLRLGSGLSRSTMTASKPSLREAMLAQKKAAMASRNLPPRPGSAMAHLSPVRSASNSSAHSVAPPKPAGLRARQEPTVSVNAGGMSVAPMRPARRRPEMTRPATAGPYSVRDKPSNVDIGSPESSHFKSSTSKLKEASPRRTAPRPRFGHASHASESGPMSPAARAASKIASPRGSPASPRLPHKVFSSPSPSMANEDITLVVPAVPSIESATLGGPATTEASAQPPPEQATEPAVEQATEPSAETSAEPRAGAQSPPVPVASEENPQPGSESPQRSLKVYEDPFTDERQQTPKPTLAVPVLEDKPVNEDAAQLQRTNGHEPMVEQVSSPEKTRQNSKLVDSGIAKIEAKALEVHGFRKLQSLIRDGRTVFADDRFEALLLGLFRYLEAPLSEVPSDKAQDVKAQVLTTIKILLKRERDNFQPFVSQGLESLLQTRSGYDSRAHVVSGLELLADELVTLGDGSEIIVVLTGRLQACADTSAEGCRTLSMGLHVLRELLDRRAGLVPSDSELAQLAALAGRALGSADSGVRMDAVKLCVSLHQRVGDAAFWEALSGVGDDPKSLITYYIVKKQREQAS